MCTSSTGIFKDCVLSKYRSGYHVNSLNNAIVMSSKNLWAAFLQNKLLKCESKKPYGSVQIQFNSDSALIQFSFDSKVVRFK